MLVAASIWLTVLNVLVAVGNAGFSMVVFGLPAEDSVGFGVAGLGVGLVFIGVAAVARPTPPVAGPRRPSPGGLGIST